MRVIAGIILLNFQMKTQFSQILKIYTQTYGGGRVWETLSWMKIIFFTQLSVQIGCDFPPTALMALSKENFYIRKEERKALF